MWAVVREPARVVKLDPAGKAEPGTVALPGEPCGGLAVDFGAVWIPLCDTRTLARVDLESLAVKTTPLGALQPTGGALTTGIGSLWILADEAGTMLRVDPDSGHAVADVYLPRGTSALAFGLKSIWAAGGAADVVVRVNPHTNLVDKSMAAAGSPGRITVGADAVWALAGKTGAVVRIDPASGRVTATIALGVKADGGTIAVGEGSVWVSAPGTPLVRIDPRTNRVDQVFTGDGGGGPLAVAHASIWLAAGTGGLSRIDPRLVTALR
ncbi:MAG TPA: hypothetical protein VMM93_06115 [Vicinamibacterales bacterium]|nr:hypothetical protein [Vicinamibacterales bacterium]